MSAIARSTLIVALLTTAAHAQSTSYYSQEAAVSQGRLVTPAGVRPNTYPRQPVTTATQNPVQPASHVESSHSDNFSATNDFEPMPLRTSGNSQRLSRESSPGSSGKRATTTVLVSLGVVLGTFFVLVWLSKKTTPKGLAPLPGEVFESLGRAPLTGRQQMQLIRLGNKLVLLSVTATGVETLTEITDIDEVNRLSGLCQQDRSGSITESFRNVLSQYADEPAPDGFVGDASASQADLANRSSRRGRRGRA